MMAENIDVWPHMSALYGALQDDDKPLQYFIPDIDVSSWEDVHANTPWRARPMPYDKLTKLFRGMCTAVGVAADWAAMFSSYTPRRFGPTCCGALGYDTEQMQALSNWQDVPEHQGKAASAKARFIMSRHYDGSTDLLSGDLKGVLVVALHAGFEFTKDGPTITKDHMEEELKVLRTLKTGEGPSKLEAMWMSDAWQVGHDEARDAAPTPAVKARSTPLQVSTQKKAEMEQKSLQSDGSDTSESESASSSIDSSDNDGGWTAHCWFIQVPNGPTHFSAQDDEHGNPIPHCREGVGSAFCRPPHMRGTFDNLKDVGGCSRGAHLSCLLRSPPRVQTAWQDALGCDNSVHHA